MLCQAVSAICRVLRLSDNRICFAGMKDKRGTSTLTHVCLERSSHAVSHQSLQAHLPKGTDARDLKTVPGQKLDRLTMWRVLPVLCRRHDAGVHGPQGLGGGA